MCFAPCLTHIYCRDKYDMGTKLPRNAALFYTSRVWVYMFVLSSKLLWPLKLLNVEKLALTRWSIFDKYEMPIVGTHCKGKIIQHWGAEFILPQSVLKEVDKKLDFIRGSSKERWKLALVSWDRSASPKKYGWLNIKSPQEMEHIFSGKTIMTTGR